MSEQTPSEESVDDAGSSPDAELTAATEPPPTASPLRLRLGVFLILVWWAPIWALAPAITHGLSGLPVPPPVAVVTGVIVVVQTIIGLLGFWVAGSQVKKIVKEAPRKRVALGQIWSIFLHGRIRDAEPPSDQ